RKHGLSIVESFSSQEELAVKHGYKLWEEKLNKRYDFLLEYTRRMETTNLRSIESLIAKTASKKSFEEKEDKYVAAALEYYLLKLKSRYNNKEMQVREMSDLQYYVWILRHGKIKN